MLLRWKSSLVLWFGCVSVLDTLQFLKMWFIWWFFFVRLGHQCSLGHLHYIHSLDRSIWSTSMTMWCFYAFSLSALWIHLLDIFCVINGRECFSISPSSPPVNPIWRPSGCSDPCRLTRVACVYLPHPSFPPLSDAGQCDLTGSTSLSFAMTQG